MVIKSFNTPVTCPAMLTTMLNLNENTKKHPKEIITFITKVVLKKANLKITK